MIILLRALWVFVQFNLQYTISEVDFETSLSWQHHVVTRVGAGRLMRRGSMPGRGTRSCIFQRPDPSLQPPGLQFSRYWAVYVTVSKERKLELCHLPAAGASMKNEWIYTSTPLHGVHRDSFTFYMNIDLMLIYCQYKYAFDGANK
jgi:hypothetical protein